MRKDKHSAVAAFMGATAKLSETRQTFEDIYNTIVDRNPSAWAAIYFDESGKPQHMTYEQMRDQVFTAASNMVDWPTSVSGIPSGWTRQNLVEVW